MDELVVTKGRDGTTALLALEGLTFIIHNSALIVPL